MEIDDVFEHLNSVLSLETRHEKKTPKLIINTGMCIQQNMKILILIFSLQSQIHFYNYLAETIRTKRNNLFGS